MKKKLLNKNNWVALFFYFFAMLNLAAQSNCSTPSFTYNGETEKVFTVSPSQQAIRVYISDTNCNSYSYSINDLDDWISTSNNSATYIDISIAENDTTSERRALITVEFTFFNRDSEDENLWGYFSIVQEYDPALKIYYVDTDLDGFGDFNSLGERSTEEISGKEDNNLDYCPNDYSLTNNGCLEPYEDINWVRGRSYDINGDLVGSSKGYFDALGKATQNQTLDIKTGRTWARHILYDTQGRPALSTLSAPVRELGDFEYAPDFFQDENNSAFNIEDFEGVAAGVDKIVNPTPVGTNTNTLGRYYSSLNDDNYHEGNSFQDITNRPYSRTIYSKLNPGAVKQTIGGNKLEGIDTNEDGAIDDKDGWKQGYSFSMPAAQEMYYVFGYDHFETNPDIQNTYPEIEDSFLNNSNFQINWLKATKTVVENVHGNEAVVFTDTDGKTLAAARAGIPENSVDEKQYEVLSLIGEQKYIDIHIPKGCDDMANFVGADRSDFIIYNLKTEELVSDANLKAGFYRIEYTGSKAFTKNHTLTYINKETGDIEPVEADAAGVRYMVNYYDFSINYYNTVGDLTASFQPIGFNKSCLDNLSSLVIHNNNAESTFSYNSLGQLISTKSPDEGTANFKYRKDGQIRFSQNSKQKDPNEDGNFSDEEFSYTNYDEFARPVESGVSYKDGGRFTRFNETVPDGTTVFIGKRKEQHITVYDYIASLSNKLSNVNGLHTDYHNPTFLSGNVATTFNGDNTFNGDDNENKISQTWYSYDLYGRVKWMVQNIDGLGVKTIDYEYDPITSQVLKVIYQKHDLAELFVHKYSYNSAQELEKVETSTDNSMFTTHADYTYYETGALKRIELAEGIQGVDYVYNLAGQLKAINHPNLTRDDDPGKDTNDLFGMTLDYYTGDYHRNPSFSLLNLGTDQYNGNIKGMTWKTQFGNTENPFQYTYEYNNNQWLTEASFNGNANQQRAVADFVLDGVITGSRDIAATNSITLLPGFEVTNNFTAKIVAATNTGYQTDDYKVSGITYDANGNILSLNRNKNTETVNDITSNEMDKLSYKYYDDSVNGDKNPNQLKRVEDTVTNATNAEDIKTQNTTNNYKYNSIGQLTKNIDENVEYFYNASGLVTEVWYNGSKKVAFYYNDKGYRTKKITFVSNSSAVEKTTYYVLDAAGSTLAIYENNTLQELPIYGASRLGIYKKPSSTSVYQLTDHLGNVRAVIAKQGTSAVALISATDYYPFGMPMPGRRIIGGYRYQYQGQEVDPETGKEAFQLRLWDGRIGRWLTTDPYRQYSSPYVGMGNDPINGIDPDGGYRTWAEAVAGWFAGGFKGKIDHVGGEGNNNYAISNYEAGNGALDSDGSFIMGTVRREYGYDTYGAVKGFQNDASAFANRTSNIATLVSQSVDATSRSAKNDLLKTGKALYTVYGSMGGSGGGLTSGLRLVSNSSKIRNFWTGGGENGPAHTAAKLATLGGESITIDMTWYGSMANKLDPVLSKYSPKLHSYMWDGASYIYAKGAQHGKVHAYFGKSTMYLEDYSVWRRVEHKELSRKGIDFVSKFGF
jgi:RHS repeat-associated protein